MGLFGYMHVLMPKCYMIYILCKKFKSRAVLGTHFLLLNQSSAFRGKESFTIPFKYKFGKVEHKLIDVGNKHRSL